MGETQSKNLNLEYKNKGHSHVNFNVNSFEDKESILVECLYCNKNTFSYFYT